jgi:hypothetical protein
MTRIGEEQSAVERVIQAWSDKWESVRFCDDALKDLVSILAVPASEEVEKVIAKVERGGRLQPSYVGTWEDVGEALALLRRLDAERAQKQFALDLLKGQWETEIAENIKLTAELATLRAVPDEVAARADEREACAKAVCPFCKSGWPITSPGVHSWVNFDGSPGPSADCKAAALRGADKDDTAGKGR